MDSDTAILLRSTRRRDLAREHLCEQHDAQRGRRSTHSGPFVVTALCRRPCLLGDRLGGVDDRPRLGRAGPHPRARGAGRRGRMVRVLATALAGGHRPRTDRGGASPRHHVQRRAHHRFPNLLAALAVRDARRVEADATRPMPRSSQCERCRTSICHPRTCWPPAPHISRPARGRRRTLNVWGSASASRGSRSKSKSSGCRRPGTSGAGHRVKDFVGESPCRRRMGHQR